MTLNRRIWLTALLAAAGFAVLTEATTKFVTYRTWAGFAWPTYLLAAAALLLFRRSAKPAAAVAVIGAAFLPLVSLVRRSTAMPELMVIEKGARLLVDTGTPYRIPSSPSLYDYNPYLPAMSTFGIVGNTTNIDLRILFGAAFVVCVVAGIWFMSRDDGRLERTGLIVAAPTCSLALVAGGDDLPVIGFILLGLTLACRNRNGYAGGIVIGAACALKAIALPALAVALATVYARNDRRAAMHFLVASACVMASTTVVPFLVDTDAFVENTIRFPLGLAETATTAASSLPGHLIAVHFAHGHAIALALMTIAATALAASLVVRSPADLTSACNRLALGLGLAVALAPATRWGYFIYPANLLLWAAMAKSTRAAERPDFTRT